jgi:hypothetical protein
MRRALLAALAVTAIFAVAVWASEEPEAADEVRGAFKNERGMLMIKEGDNHWYVLDDAKHGKPYFFDANRNISQWHDPRGPSAGERRACRFWDPASRAWPPAPALPAPRAPQAPRSPGPVRPPGAPRRPRCPLFALLGPGHLLTRKTASAAWRAEDKASGKKVAANVQGVYKNNRGQYLLEHEGHHWYVIDDNKNGQPYFFDANRNISQWEDPRGHNYDTFGASVHSEL